MSKFKVTVEVRFAEERIVEAHTIEQAKKEALGGQYECFYIEPTEALEVTDTKRIEPYSSKSEQRRIKHQTKKKNIER